MARGTFGCFGWALLAAGAAGCFDTPHESRVRVTVSGLSVVAGMHYSGDSVEVAVVFADRSAVVDGGGAGGDAGGVDGGADTEMRRVIQWDEADPMVFYVQVPARTYAAVRAEARVGLVCRRNGADQVVTTVIAAGRANGAVTVTSDDGTEVTVDVTAVPPACPTM